MTVEVMAVSVGLLPVAGIKDPGRRQLKKGLLGPQFKGTLQSW